MTDIRSLYPEELKTVLAEMGEKPFRADQLFSWLHAKKAASYDEMTNLSLTLRQKLAEKYPLSNLEAVDCLISKLDDTRKYLFRLADGNVIESVRMKYSYGNSVCISTQAGCAMGCTFCASAIGGKIRDLTAGEMLQQVYTIEKLTRERVSNVVMMGTGEPLDNYDNSVRFIRLISHEKGLNISQRNITLSTCGLVPRIRELAQKKLQLTLSISLHAPTDEIRSTIMPVNKAYPTEELLQACREYYELTNRRISFEYAMIDGVNDTEEAARLLLKRLKGLPAHFNLIPLNHVEESPLKPSSKAAVARFQQILEKGGIPATVRRTLGGDIDASCGQLRRKYTKQQTSDLPGKE